MPAGGSTCQNDNLTTLEKNSRVGQHPRIHHHVTIDWFKLSVGHHPRMVGQHESERWVNMDQNLHQIGNNTYLLPATEWE